MINPGQQSDSSLLLAKFFVLLPIFYIFAAGYDICNRGRESPILLK